MDCFQSMPKKVKVGPYDWTVTVLGSDEERCGHVDFETRVITLWQDNITGPPHAVGILIHECLHIIYDNEKLSTLRRDKEEREEQIVLAYEAGIVSLLRDNPKLVNWIRKYIKE